MMATAAFQIGACAPQRDPAHLVLCRRLADGTPIVVRPIQPEDDAIETAFIGGLSSDTRYNRLLGARKLTPEEIRRLTRIDYAQEMAYVAVTGQAEQVRLLGVARYVRDADAAAEFALVVADAWQRRGVGTLLLDTLLRHAHAAGIVRLLGITLATNQAMQKLARKLGFTQTLYPRDATVRQVEKILAHTAAPTAQHSSAQYQDIAANDETRAHASRSGRL